MLKELQFTLYDFFGYFLPGAVILLAVVILLSTLFWPWEPLNVLGDPSSFQIAILTLSAYFLGHIGQGVGNLLERIPSIRKLQDETLPLSAELSRALYNAIESSIEVNPKTLAPREIFTLCDETLLHHGSGGEREIFTYREGFYRGQCIAFSALSFSVLVRSFWVPAKMAVGDRVFELGAPFFFLCFLFTSLGAFLSFKRYQRFLKRRIVSCLVRFLALCASGERTPKEGMK